MAILWKSGLELEKTLLTSIGKPETTFNYDREGLLPDLRAAKFY
jgi:hypothetical protein